MTSDDSEESPRPDHVTVTISRDFDGNVVGAVPIEELEALADDWMRGWPHEERERCAQDIREVISKYE